MITTFFVVTACKLMAIKSYAALNNYDLHDFIYFKTVLTVTLSSSSVCWPNNKVKAYKFHGDTALIFHILNLQQWFKVWLMIVNYIGKFLRLRLVFIWFVSWG